jgi:hypothetical protein
MMRWLNTIAWVATFVGVACGLYLLLTGIDRNTQGEFINDAGALDYRYALLHFIVGFLIGAIATAIVLSFVLGLTQIIVIALSSSLSGFRRSGHHDVRAGLGGSATRRGADHHGPAPPSSPGT